MRPYYLFRDTLHGIQAKAGGPIEAFQLIKNACIERGVQVPAFAQIKKVAAATSPHSTL